MAFSIQSAHLIGFELGFSLGNGGKVCIGVVCKVDIPITTSSISSPKCCNSRSRHAISSARIHDFIPVISNAGGWLTHSSYCVMLSLALFGGGIMLDLGSAFLGMWWFSSKNRLNKTGARSMTLLFLSTMNV